MSGIPDTRASLIVRLPQAADIRAWDEFVGIYGPLVYRLARRRGLQPGDADDLVQEVFAAVSRSIESWLANPNRGPFRAWLLRIARNATVNYLTRRRHQPLGTGDSAVARQLQQHAEVAVEGDSEFPFEYRREIFRWAAAQVQATVTDQTWKAFWRTAIEGRSPRDVARQLGTSVGSIYIARSRVMARLRELVRRFEELDS